MAHFLHNWATAAVLHQYMCNCCKYWTQAEKRLKTTDRIKTKTIMGSETTTTACGGGTEKQLVAELFCTCTAADAGGFNGEEPVNKLKERMMKKMMTRSMECCQRSLLAISSVSFCQRH